MKNVLAVLALAGIFAMVACKGNKEDKEKAKQDSIQADSTPQVKKDSMGKTELEKARQDSIAKADSMMKAQEAKETTKK